MFSIACTILAAIMAAFSIPEYKRVAQIVALEFALHLVSAGLLMVDILNNWSIYLSYAIIQVVVMGYLYKFMCHFYIISFIFINLLLNLIAFNYAYDFWVLGEHKQEFISIYNIYPNLARTIMLFELAYLFFLGRYVANHLKRYGAANTDYIDRLFRCRARFCVGSAA